MDSQPTPVSSLCQHCLYNVFRRNRIMQLIERQSSSFGCDIKLIIRDSCFCNHWRECFFYPFPVFSLIGFRFNLLRYRFGIALGCRDIRISFSQNPISSLCSGKICFEGPVKFFDMLQLSLSIFLFFAFRILYSFFGSGNHLRKILASELFQAHIFFILQELVFAHSIKCLHEIVEPCNFIFRVLLFCLCICLVFYRNTLFGKKGSLQGSIIFCVVYNPIKSVVFWITSLMSDEVMGLFHEIFRCLPVHFLLNLLVNLLICISVDVIFKRRKHRCPGVRSVNPVSLVCFRIDRSRP